MSHGYPGDMTQADHDRAMGFRSLRDEAAMQRALESRAEDEAIAGAQAFRDWLADYGSAAALAVVVCGVSPERDEWGRPVKSRADMIADARHALIRDYVSYRVDTFDDDDREEVAAELFGEAA